MIHLIALLISQASYGVTGSACSGADPSIATVTKAKSTDANDLNRYALTIAVTNVGSKAQKANTLQSIEIILDGTKNGQKSVPPLRPGQTYSFTYDVLRARGARHGSTAVELRLVTNGSGAQSSTDCARAIETRRVSI